MWGNHGAWKNFSLEVLNSISNEFETASEDEPVSEVVVLVYLLAEGYTSP